MSKSTLRNAVQNWTLVVCLLSGTAFAQFGSTVARRVVSGTGVPPATCINSPADIYVRTGATLPGFYVCLTTNTWTGPLGTGSTPGAGGSNTQIQFNSSATLGGITGWTTSNGTTNITGAASAVLDLSAITLSNFKLPAIAANSVYGNCTGGSAAPAACSLVNAMLPTTMTGITIDTATPTEVGYLSGVTSAIQTQFTGKAAATAATTVNSQTCTLSSTCTIPFQTNSGNNTSQAGINLLTSTANTVGLTVTPTNSATNAEKFEITGASYTGNAATATDLAAGSTLAVGKGGTGTTTFTAHGVLLGQTASAITATAAGTQYQFLQAGATDPGWSSWKLPATGGTNAQCLTSNGTDAVWGACSTGTISGSMTTGTIPVATGASAVGDSLLTTASVGQALLFSGTGGFSLTGAGTFLKALEGTAPTGAAGSDWLYGDSSAHRWKVKNNSNTADTVALFSDNLSVFAATTSAQLAGVLSDETGSGGGGLAVFNNGPTLIAPALGAATATSINGLTITSSTGTLTITNAKTVSFPHTITLTSSGDSSVITFPNATTTALTTNAAVTAAQGGTGADLSGAASGGYPKANGAGAFATSTGAAAGTGSCTNQVVTAENGDAAPTCTTITSAYVSNTIALTGTDINTSNQVTVTHLASALPVNQGGSGFTTATIHGVLIGETTAAFNVTSAGTTGIPLVGVTGADPAFGTAVVAGGGTGLTTALIHGLLVGEGTSALASVVAGTQYQFLISNGAADPGWSSWQLPATGGSNAQCLTSNGTNAVWGACSTGSVTGSGLVSGQVAVATSSSALTSYSTFLSDSSGNVTAASITISNANPGIAYLGQGTTPWGIGTTSVGLTAPTSVTSYNLVVPSAASAGTDSTTGAFYLKFGNSQNQTGCTASPTELCGYLQSTIGLAAASGDVSGVLPSANGGSGVASPTAHTVLLGEGSSAFGTVSVGTTGSIMIGNSAADPTWATTIPLGNSGNSGILSINGSSSGVITIQPQAAAGTYNWNWPITAGSAAQCLVSQGGGSTAMTWGACGGAVAWSGLTNPSGALALTMATGDNTQFTYTGNTSTANLFSLIDATGNTGTGAIFEVHSVGSSTALPVQFTAQGTTAGVKMDTAGLLQAIGSGGIRATTLGGATFASPGAIGGGTPGSAAFTTITGTSSITLGVNGGTGGTVVVNGSGTGSLTIAVQSTAGSPTWTAGTSSGTPAVTASLPLAIVAATGNETCTTCVTSASSLGANALVVGSGGAQGTATGSADFTYVTHTLSSGAAGIFDLSSATGTAAFKVPTASTASAAGVIDYDSTATYLNYHFYPNGADAMILGIAALPTTGHLLDTVVTGSHNIMAHDSGIATSTVTTNASALTSTALMTGGGSNAAQTPSTTSTLSSAGVLQLAAGGSIGSADTGSPTFTFAANKATFNSGTPASALLDLSGITNTAGFKVPTNTTNTATAAGVIDFDTTNKDYHAYVNAADSKLAVYATVLTPTASQCATWTAAGSAWTLGSTACATTLDALGNLAASKTFADSTYTLAFTSTLGATGSQNAFSFSEAAATTGASDVEVQISTATTTTAIPLQITQGAAAPNGANAPAVLNISAAASGGVASGHAGYVGAPIGLLTGAGSGGNGASNNGGAGGAFTITTGAGGLSGGASGTGGAGGNIVLNPGAGGGANGGTAGSSGYVSVGGNLIASGIVDGTAPVTLTAGTSASLGGTYSSGYTFNQETVSQSAEVTYTLPTAAIGKQYCVANDEYSGTAITGILRVNTSAAGQHLRYKGTVGSTGGYIRSGGAAGDAACFVGVSTTDWVVYVQLGTWTQDSGG